MSSLKFRAWDKKHLKYTKVLKVYFGSDGSNLGALVEDYETNYAFELQANQVEFEQYTGLKDKNGKEIYEGDILTWTDGFDEKHIFRVEWQENRAKFCLRNPGGHWDYEEINDKKRPYMEVVGNIHEPPKDFRPEHLKRMGVSISKGGEE